MLLMVTAVAPHLQAAVSVEAAVVPGSPAMSGDLVFPSDNNMLLVMRSMLLQLYTHVACRDAIAGMHRTAGLTCLPASRCTWRCAALNEANQQTASMPAMQFCTTPKASLFTSAQCFAVQCRTSAASYVRGHDVTCAGEVGRGSRVLNGRQGDFMDVAGQSAAKETG